MNRKRWLSQTMNLTLLAALLLIACGAPTPTSVPTLMPTLMPTATPTFMSIPTTTPTDTPAPTSTFTSTPTSTFTSTPTFTPTPTSTPTSTPTPTPLPISIVGRAYVAGEPSQPASDREVVLCLVEKVSQEEDDPFVTASCVLVASLTTTTDSEGHFEFQDVANGSYMLLYDKPAADFEAGLREWDGKTVKVWDDEWYSQFRNQKGELGMGMLIMQGLGTVPADALLLVAALDMYIGDIEGFPFLIATEVDLESVAFSPVFIEVKTGETVETDFEMFGN